MNESVVLQLVTRIYDAAIDPTQWTTFLRELAPLTGGHTTVLVTETLGTRSAVVSAAIGVDQSYWAEYEEHFAGINPYYQGAAERLMIEGAFMPGQLACPAVQFERSEYYNDYLRRLDLFHAFGAIVEREGGILSVLTSLRPRRAGAWNAELEPLFHTLLPHVRRAMKMNRRLAETPGSHTHAASLLGLTHLAAAVLDCRGYIVFSTSAADALFDAADCIIRDKHQLRCPVPSEHLKLQGALATAAKVAAGESHQRIPALSLRSSFSDRSLDVMLVPLKTPGPSIAVVFGARASLRFDEHILRDLFQLTRVEAEVAAGVGSGLNVRELAAELGLTEATARWYVKQVLSKTKTRSQADLVRLVIRSIAALDPRVAKPK